MNLAAIGSQIAEQIAKEKESDKPFPTLDAISDINAGQDPQLLDPASASGSTPAPLDPNIWREDPYTMPSIEERSGLNVFKGTDDFIQRHMNPKAEAIDWGQAGGTQALIRLATQESDLRETASHAPTFGVTSEDVATGIGESYQNTAEVAKMPQRDREEENRLMGLIFQTLPPEQQASFQTLSPTMQQFALGFAAASLIGGDIISAGEAVTLPVGMEQQRMTAQRKIDQQTLDAQKQEAAFRLEKLQGDYKTDLDAFMDNRRIDADLEKTRMTVEGRENVAEIKSAADLEREAMKIASAETRAGVTANTSKLRGLLGVMDKVPFEQWANYVAAVDHFSDGKIKLNPDQRGMTANERLQATKAADIMATREARIAKIRSAIRVDNARAELYAKQVEWFDEKTQTQIDNLLNLMDYRNAQIELGGMRIDVSRDQAIASAANAVNGLVKQQLEGAKTRVANAEKATREARIAKEGTSAAKALQAIQDAILKEDSGADFRQDSRWQAAKAALDATQEAQAEMRLRKQWEQELAAYKNAESGSQKIIQDALDSVGATAEDNGGPNAGKVLAGLKAYGFAEGQACPKGVDCSNFIQSFFAKSFGKRLPRTTSEQVKAGVEVNPIEIKEGDLVFFDSPRRRGDPRPRGVGHVGVYLGGGRFAHAGGGTLGPDFKSPSGYKYKIDTLNDNYWSSKLVSIRRV